MRVPVSESSALCSVPRQIQLPETEADTDRDSVCTPIHEEEKEGKRSNVSTTTTVSSLTWAETQRGQRCKGGRLLLTFCSLLVTHLHV